MDQEFTSPMRTALPAAGSDELWLAFQPLRAIASGELRGFEALMRWTHPIDGVISPDDFIPQAELCGDINGLGAWALTVALDHLVAWRTERPDLDLNMNVNVATGQLCDREFAGFVLRTLNSRKLELRCLTLELTHASSLTDPRAAESIDALHGLGISLAADDVGSEIFPEAMMELPRFKDSIGKVKIDRSVVLDAIANPKRLATIVDAAQAMGAIITAEGSEEIEQVEMLQRLGVDLGQAFNPWGMPVAASEIDQLIEQERFAQEVQVA